MGILRLEWSGGGKKDAIRVRGQCLRAVRVGTWQCFQFRK